MKTSLKHQSTPLSPYLPPFRVSHRSVNKPFLLTLRLPSDPLLPTQFLKTHRDYLRCGNPCVHCVRSVGAPPHLSEPPLCLSHTALATPTNLADANIECVGISSTVSRTLLRSVTHGSNPLNCADNLHRYLQAVGS